MGMGEKTELKPYYDHAGITIYHGDCRDILPHLEPVDLVLTDPPYGIGADKGKHKESSDKSGFYRVAIRREYNDTWDIRPENELIKKIIKTSEFTILWGGNYFAHGLLESQRWLVWNKCNTMPTFSDCELAWTNLSGTSVKMFKYSGNGLLAREKERFHPTQKPIALMKWCLSFKDGTVLDPFMGSGTTLVAAKELGRKAIGIEIEEKYCEIAVRRLAQEILPFNRKEES